MDRGGTPDRGVSIYNFASAQAKLPASELAAEADETLVVRGTKLIKSVDMFDAPPQAKKLFHQFHISYTLSNKLNSEGETAGINPII